MEEVFKLIDFKPAVFNDHALLTEVAIELANRADVYLDQREFFEADYMISVAIELKSEQTSFRLRRVRCHLSRLRSYEALTDLDKLSATTGIHGKWKLLAYV